MFFMFYLCPRHLFIRKKKVSWTLKGNINDSMQAKFLDKRRLKLQNTIKLNIAQVEGIRKAASDKDLPSIHVVFINVKSRVDSETDTPNRYYGLQYDTTGEFSPSVIGIDLNTREHILLFGALAKSDRIMNL